jgi:hypothetical protein
MANYVNTYNGQTRSSDTFLGYPWVELDASTGEPEGSVEFAERTAEAILLDVGTDPELAAIALRQEAARETPRKVLTGQLRKIIRDAEAES